MSEEKKKIEDGGAAFPMTDGVKHWNDGMTLRDYFAGQALAGLAASEACGPQEKFARYSYELADAMIAEREK